MVFEDCLGKRSCVHGIKEKSIQCPGNPPQTLIPKQNGPFSTFRAISIALVPGEEEKGMFDKLPRMRGPWSPQTTRLVLSPLYT